ncbi:hypothetical protein ABH922_005421 [Rhodococcus sp. 27YEA15]|uniref:hypothetical protein n=1 Tax=Rhodococcus sp. 27YEA15 TaxID=3156259 RepID=UPI003C7CB0FC
MQFRSGSGRRDRGSEPTGLRPSRRVIATKTGLQKVLIVLHDQLWRGATQRAVTRNAVVECAAGGGEYTAA